MAYTKDELYDKLKASLDLINDQIITVSATQTVSIESDLNSKYKDVESSKNRMISALESIKTGILQHINETLCYAAEYHYLEQAEYTMSKLISKIEYFNTVVNSLMFDYIEMMKNPDTYDEGCKLLSDVLGTVNDENIEASVDEDGNVVVTDSSKALLKRVDSGRKTGYCSLASNSALMSSSLEYLYCSMDSDSTVMDEYETDLQRDLVMSIPIGKCSNIQMSSLLSGAWEYDTGKGVWAFFTNILESQTAKLYRNNYYGLTKNAQGEVYGFSLSFKKNTSVVGSILSLFSSAIYTNFMDDYLSSGYKLKLKKGYEVMTYEQFHSLALEDEVDNKDTVVYFEIEFEGQSYYIMEDGSETYSSNIILDNTNSSLTQYLKFDGLDLTSDKQLAESVTLISHHQYNGIDNSFTLELDFDKVEDGYHRFTGDWELTEDSTIPIAVVVKPLGGNDIEYYVDYDANATCASTEYSIIYPALASIQTRRHTVTLSPQTISGDDLSMFPEYNLAAINYLLTNGGDLDQLSNLLNLLIQQYLDEIFALMKTTYSLLDTIGLGFSTFQSNCSNLSSEFTYGTETDVITLKTNMEEEFTTGFDGLTMQEQVERLNSTYNDKVYANMYNTIVECLNTSEGLIDDHLDTCYTAVDIIDSYSVIGNIKSIDNSAWNSITTFYNVYTKNMGDANYGLDGMIRMSFGTLNSTDWYDMMIDQTNSYILDMVLLYISRVILSEISIRKSYNNLKYYDKQTEFLKKNLYNYKTYNIGSTEFRSLIEREDDLYRDYKLRISHTLNTDSLPTTIEKYSPYIYSLNNYYMEDLIGVYDNIRLDNKVIKMGMTKEILRLKDNPKYIKSIMDQFRDNSIRDIVIRIYMIEAMITVNNYLIESSNIEQVIELANYQLYLNMYIGDYSNYIEIFNTYYAIWSTLYADGKYFENNLNYSNTDFYEMMIR